MSSSAIESVRADEQPPVLLSIAGFDPSSGAGVSADIRVFAAHGLYGMACVTALTVQSTLGVREVHPVAAANVTATLQMLAEDVAFAGVKIGMLGTAEVTIAVADFLDDLPTVPVVLDPVLRSSSGRELLESQGVEVLRGRLLWRVDWITPNLDEISTLTGATVTRRGEIPEAAEHLKRLARKAGNSKLNILVTGGDFNPPEEYLLTADGEGFWLRGERVATSSTHGTGCALSSALLCGLVQGQVPLNAASAAKKYVAGALRAATPIGRGRGPMNHFFAGLPGANDSRQETG